MRKVFCIAVAVFMMASSAYAASDTILEGMGKKAVRGAVNIISSPLEIPMQIIKGYDKGFEPITNDPASRTVGAVLGIFRGFSHAAGRMLWGGIELLGFWTANPEDNKGVGIPFDGEYSWEEGQQYSIFKPDFEEGIKPVGRKLGRGLANTFLGIAEVPGQIRLGAQEGNVLAGTVRGVWFWLSREVYGLGSVLGCIVPNPEENPGYSFNRAEPWEALTGSNK